jgi:hypothetical protein
MHPDRRGDLDVAIEIKQKNTPAQFKAKLS